jgi:predicted AAA+ superfamily ATPase
MTRERYLTKYVIEDLKKKMVFVGGPRQVGKTTLALELISKRFGRSGYFNWDSRIDRRNIMQSIWPGDADLIILDEIHKYKKWKSFVKGEYDTLKEKYRFLITGSARLDIYPKGGDSMLGRYHYYRLHPFTLAEAAGRTSMPEVMKEIPIPSKSERDIFKALNKFGGFPEPCCSGKISGTLNRLEISSACNFLVISFPTEQALCYRSTPSGKILKSVTEPYPVGLIYSSLFITVSGFILMWEKIFDH